MLIEVHGYGLCGSEYALRRVLADAVLDNAVFDKHRSFGNPGVMQNHIARECCDREFTQELNADGTPSLGSMEEEETIEMPLPELLQHIAPVTDVGGKSGWMMHRVTHQNQHGRSMRMHRPAAPLRQLPGPAHLTIIHCRKLEKLVDALLEHLGPPSQGRPRCSSNSH